MILIIIYLFFILLLKFQFSYLPTDTHNITLPIFIINQSRLSKLKRALFYTRSWTAYRQRFYHFKRFLYSIDFYAAAFLNPLPIFDTTQDYFIAVYKHATSVRNLFLIENFKPFAVISASVLANFFVFRMPNNHSSQVFSAANILLAPKL